jgi:hypothetical protein
MLDRSSFVNQETGELQSKVSTLLIVSVVISFSATGYVLAGSEVGLLQDSSTSVDINPSESGAYVTVAERGTAERIAVLVNGDVDNSYDEFGEGEVFLVDASIGDTIVVKKYTSSGDGEVISTKKMLTDGNYERY